jgi:hypothetical protein
MTHPWPTRDFPRGDPSGAQVTASDANRELPEKSRGGVGEQIFRLPEFQFPRSPARGFLRGDLRNSDADRERMEAVKQGRGIQGFLGTWISGFLGSRTRFGLWSSGDECQFFNFARLLASRLSRISAL